jgi:uncharacterized protein (TIGR03083 family)
MLSKPQPILVIDLFPEILAELLNLLERLTQADWDRPTACPGWTVKDVALHLLGIEIGNLSRRRDGHALPQTTVNDWSELVGVLRDWNESWVESARRMSAPLLTDLLGRTGGQWCDYVRTLDPFALGGAVSWAGPHPAPIWLDLAREYTERWHHQQHIRDAVGQPGLKAPRCLRPVLEAFSRALPRAFESATAPSGMAATLTISGAAGGQWTIVRERETWQLYRGAPEMSAAEAEMNEETAWRLFTHGLSAEQAQRQVKLSGDLSLSQHFLEMIAIIA